MPSTSVLLAWLRSFAPAPAAGSRRELWLGSIGAGLGLLLGQWLSHALLGQSNPWFIAPMAATAVLLFAVPASPFAQPWPVMLGNVLSALVGVACYQWLGATPSAAALATAGAVAVMASLRCLHPPGGAIALTAVLGGPVIHKMGFGFAGWLVAVNSALLLLLAVAFNNLAGRRYPHVAAPRSHPRGAAEPLARLQLKEDIAAALARCDEVLDIGVDDLEAILLRAQLHASRRRLGDIMARDVVVVAAEAAPQQAWALLERRRLGALPVVDSEGRLVGTVALADFFVPGAMPPRLRDAARVDEIMAPPVRAARADATLADLVDAFRDGGISHLPVIDPQRRVIGMVTQADLVAALCPAGSR